MVGGGRALKRWAEGSGRMGSGVWGRGSKTDASSAVPPGTDGGAVLNADC